MFKHMIELKHHKLNKGWAMKKFIKVKDFVVKHASIIILGFLGYIGFSNLVSAGTNQLVVYGLGLVLIGSLLNNVYSK